MHRAWVLREGLFSWVVRLVAPSAGRTTAGQAPTQSDEAFAPTIVAFCCHYCAYTAADLAGASRISYPPNIRIVRLPCSGRIDVVTILQTFIDGADGGCVTVCLTGGEQAVSVLAAELRLKDQTAGRERTITERTITRQCDAEYLAEIAEDARDADVVLSTACGVGINYMTEVLAGPIVMPAMNTLFMGTNIAPGQWSERCAGCGNCMLEKTGGICPIARCSKSLMNGPCGGTNDGKCEVSSDIDCAWALIVQRMTDLGRLDDLLEVMPPRDWSTSRHGGPRHCVTVEAPPEPGTEQ